MNELESELSWHAKELKHVIVYVLVEAVIITNTGNNQLHDAAMIAAGYHFYHMLTLMYSYLNLERELTISFNETVETEERGNLI
jgi:hypothetical protein